jgi:beta-alanine--pyruvate transaminase
MKRTILNEQPSPPSAADPSDDLSQSYWMPFTANRDFFETPRIVNRANGMYLYTTVVTKEDPTANPKERAILDATAGLWCCNLGHCRPEITEAVTKQLDRLDYTSVFNFGHKLGFEYADRLVQYTPHGLDHVFFGTSGSDAIETALKIALQYWRVQGEGQKHRFIGRQKAYHGVNFGGMSVGGLTSNFKTFGQWLHVDHLKHTLDIERNAFSRGLPKHGGIEMAEELEELFIFHGAENVAAVVMEPIAGAGGVILPPQGYLAKIREICTRYNVLLIFDEVITGWGRTGSAFAAPKFDVGPDMITSAKGITNGAIPLSAVFVSNPIYDACMQKSKTPMEFFHGYTYSCHPVACAAGMASLDIYEREQLLVRAGGSIGQYWEDALHSLKDLPQVCDVRNYGLVGAIEIRGPPISSQTSSMPLGPSLQSLAWEKGLMVRGIGNALCMSPPLIVEEKHIDQITTVLRDVIQTVPEM